MRADDAAGRRRVSKSYDATAAVKTRA
jgi:hypothetical protein